MDDVRLGTLVDHSMFSFSRHSNPKIRREGKTCIFSPQCPEKAFVAHDCSTSLNAKTVIYTTQKVVFNYIELEHLNSS